MAVDLASAQLLTEADAEPEVDVGATELLPRGVSACSPSEDEGALYASSLPEPSEEDEEDGQSKEECRRRKNRFPSSSSGPAPSPSTGRSQASEGSFTRDDAGDSLANDTSQRSLQSQSIHKGRSHLNGLLATLELDEVTPEGVSIICVGVMRTGAKTLHRALRNLGYSNIWDQEDIISTFDEWDQVMRDKSTMDNLSKIFNGSEVIMGMPTFCFWEQLVDLYPEARVILTVRDEDDWWRSVRNAEAQMHRNLPGAPLRYGSLMRSFEAYLMPSYHRFCEVLRFAWAATLGAHALEGETVNEHIARSSYRKHNSYVELALGSKKTERGGPKLLIYNVHDGWAPLCEFLGKDIPEVEFPMVKHVPYFPGEEACGSQPQGHSFEEMMLPDSRFGMRLRKEMRWGLMKGFIATTTVLTVVLFLLSCSAFQVPVALIAVCYLVLIGTCWNVYVVINNLVLRVPALVVLPMAMKSFLIAGALQMCLLSYGMLKEMLVTQDHIASPVLVLSSRFGAIICSSLLLLCTEGTLRLGAPITSMAAFAFTNEASTWAGYEMLKYVSFPVTVMAKSVKMLPSMLMGRVLNGAQYSPLQYVQALAALMCVAFMQLSEDSSQHSKRDDGDMSPLYKLGMGIAVLIMFFVFDSFTSQWQDKLYKRHPNITQTQMMLGGNLMGFLMTSGTLVAAWPKVRQSAGMAAENPAILGRIIALGVVYALGQFCIYSAIRILGPLSFTWIMTARQLLSVLISLVFFGHGVSVAKVVCIFVVFAIMSAKQLTKAMPKITRQAKRLQRKLQRTVTGAAQRVQFEEEATWPTSPRSQRPSLQSTAAATETDGTKMASFSEFRASKKQV